MTASEDLAKKKEKAGQRRRGAVEGSSGAVDHLPLSASGFSVGSAVGSEIVKAVGKGEGARRCGNEEYEVCGRGCVRVCVGVYRSTSSLLCAMFVNRLCVSPVFGRRFSDVIPMGFFNLIFGWRSADAAPCASSLTRHKAYSRD